MEWFKVDWNIYKDQLLEVIQKENWSNPTYPGNKILVNYMAKTVDKLRADKQIISTEDYAVLNTGLFDEYYEPIYAYQDKNEIIFGNSYRMATLNVEDLPSRANYFNQPELLLFDWNLELRVHLDHILGDARNRERLPECDNSIILLNGAIDNTRRRVTANYKLAIPQYFNNQIQLLLPLWLGDHETPDLALVVTRCNRYYLAHTCITIDMAYNNARLIAKPESNWLTI